MQVPSDSVLGASSAAWSMNDCLLYRNWVQIHDYKYDLLND